MITDKHRERVADGRLPHGRVRGVVEFYDLSEAFGDNAADTARLTVSESDLEGVVPGQVVTVVMPEPADANFGVRDLRNGFDHAGLDPVPEGSEVTFEHCLVDEAGRVEAASYDLTDISRPSLSTSHP